jgi:hypothetical protein
VNYFTLRIIISLMETIKDVYIRVGRALLDGTLGRGFSFWRLTCGSSLGRDYGTISCVAGLL